VSVQLRPESSAAMTGLPAQLLHDLRSPLNQIIGYSEMLSEDAEGQRREDFMKIRAAGHRMLAVIEENFTSIHENSTTIAGNDREEMERESTAVTRHLTVAPGLVLVVDDDAGNRDVL